MQAPLSGIVDRTGTLHLKIRVLITASHVSSLLVWIMSTTESTYTGCSSAPIGNTIPARSARYSISSIRTAYQQFSELKNIREYAEGLQSSLNEVRDEDVNKAPLEYCDSNVKFLQRRSPKNHLAPQGLVVLSLNR